MEQRPDLTLEQSLTSELSRMLKNEPWETIEDEDMGLIQLRGREIDVARGKIVISQVCQHGDLGSWQNTVQIDTDTEKALYSWFRDGVFKIEKPLELQSVMDEITDLIVDEDETS